MGRIVDLSGSLFGIAVDDILFNTLRLVWGLTSEIRDSFSSHRRVKA